MPFTHVAKYQGRIVADAIMGRPRPARYDGIPRSEQRVDRLAPYGQPLGSGPGRRRIDADLQAREAGHGTGELVHEVLEGRSA